jgi:hypothetical protein
VAIAILAMVAVCAASGQDQPPVKEPEPAQQTATEPAKPRIQLGWSGWNLKGNAHKFRQYATPAEGFFVREVGYDWWQGAMRDGAGFYFLTPGEEDYRGRASLSLRNGATRIVADTDRARFFDRTPILIGGSQRQASEGYIRHDITPDLSLTFRARMDQEDHNFEPPKDPLRQRTRMWNLSAAGSLGAGFADLSYTDWRYFDRTNVLPDTEMQRWGVSYTHPLTPNANITGSFVRNTIRQTGSDNTVEGWSLNGDWDVNDSTAFIFDARRENLDLPSVTNAYVRKRSLARGRIIHRMGAWTAQLGYGRFDFERVRGDQLFVDVPKWHTFDARLSGRLSPSVRMTARVARHTMDGSAQMLTLDPRALYWDERAFGEVKFDLSRELFNGYLVYSFRENKNDVRDTQVRNHSLTVGGSWQAAPQLEVFFEGTNDMWSAKSGDPENPNLDQFFGDGTAFTIGGNWAINPQAYASASFTHLGSRNDNPLGVLDANIRASFVTASFNYRLPSGMEVGLTFAPWRYSDRSFSAMGYNSFLINLVGNVRF